MKWKSLVDMATQTLSHPYNSLESKQKLFLYCQCQIGGVSHPEYITKTYINTSVENVGFQMYKFYLYNMINGLNPTRI